MWFVVNCGFSCVCLVMSVLQYPVILVFEIILKFQAIACFSGCRLTEGTLTRGCWQLWLAREWLLPVSSSNPPPSGDSLVIQRDWEIVFFNQLLLKWIPSRMGPFYLSKLQILAEVYNCCRFSLSTYPPPRNRLVGLNEDSEWFLCKQIHNSF